MSEVIREPELTRVLKEIDMRGMDTIALLEVTDEGVRWRGDALPRDVPLTARDREILDMSVEGFDEVQVVLSKMRPAHDGIERHTYKTRFLPVEAVKKYLGGRHDSRNNRV